MQGVTVEAPGEQRPGLSIVSSVCWEGNDNRPDALPTEGVLADGDIHKLTQIPSFNQ